MSSKSPSPAPKLRAGVVQLVSVKSLHPDPDQPRKTFDEKSLQALAANITAGGIKVPISVRIADKGRITIVDGERRFRAAKLAKLPVVPVLLAVAAGSDEQLRLDQVAVNQLREKLKPMDLARVLRSMRDTGKTTNDIAAMLAQQGHEAMKPAQVDAMAALTDLPGWLQGMVDAEELTAAPAGKLQPIVSLAGVEKPLRHRLTQLTGYKGRLDPRDVTYESQQVLGHVFADLNQAESWHRNQVHFAWKTRCKGCEHLLSFEGAGYCRNARLFKEHNQEARDAGLLPGGKRPEKPKASTGKAAEREQEKKAEVRELSLAEKARGYLHRHLVTRLAAEFQENVGLQERIVVWQALGRPGTNAGYGMDRPAAVVRDERPSGIVSLEQMTATAVGYHQALATAAVEAIYKLPWRESHALARHLWGDDLNAVWNPELAFLDLFRKTELAHLAERHQCPPPAGKKTWLGLKSSDMRLALMEQHDKWLRPAILADLYQGEIEKPYSNRYGYDLSDEDAEFVEEQENCPEDAALEKSLEDAEA